MRLPLAKLRNNSIPAEDARAAVEWIRHWRPMEIATDDARGFRHPWQVAMRWADDRKVWEAQFHRSSYLGGPEAREVLAPPMEWRRLPRATRSRFGDEDPREPVRPWLSEEPLIPLRESQFRRLGHDADRDLAGSAETIPPALLDLGAATGEEVRIDRDELSFTVGKDGPPVDRARIRLCRAVDLVLNVERQRVRLEAGSSLGEVAIVLDLPPASESVYLTVQRDRLEPRAEPEALLDQFAAALDDSGVDQRLAARVYLLSRPGAADGSPIDSTWQPYVQQGLFWNPQHRTTRELDLIEPRRLAVQTGLALGAGDALIQATLADLDQRAALASLLLSQARVRGRFFT